MVTNAISSKSESMIISIQNPAEEQLRNNIEHSLRRQDPLHREVEQGRDTQANAERRQDPLYREEKQERNTREHADRRQDPQLE